MNKTVLSSIGILIAICGGWYLVNHFANQQQTNTKPLSALFSCAGGNTIAGVFYDGEVVPGATADEPPTPSGHIDLTLSDGRTMTLQQTISADGVRFVNADESFVFWNKGNGALVLEQDEEKTYTGCVVVAPVSEDSLLSRVYSSNDGMFSVRLPGGDSGYTVDEHYQYQVSPEKIIKGTKFTIPTSHTTGTNLSKDTYISVETIPTAETCTADLFFDGVHNALEEVRSGVTYSVATSSNAGAGNRYDEAVYALSGTNPCVAVRYFVHYTAVQNYDPGTVAEFNGGALIGEFDSIRDTLVVNQ
ncbi:MliC family protein [Candidatus Campbellbacteria bacterium]|nr:MAG: MliC family protein [Candidatus Campbellbacteria bacterium]